MLASGEFLGLQNLHNQVNVGVPKLCAVTVQRQPVSGKGRGIERVATWGFESWKSGVEPRTGSLSETKLD